MTVLICTHSFGNYGETMRKIIVCFLACIILGAAPGATAAWAESGVIYQSSTISALKEGRYTGDTSFGELKKHGDFGLGTVNGLDGEMIALDGSFFQVKADGNVYPLDDAAKTPFAVVTFLKPDRTLVIGKVRSLKKLLEALDSIIPDPDAMYAIRIDGLFRQVKARSVPPQKEPYPTLSEALRGEKIFELADVTGTLAGFRFPGSMKGMNVEGYHFHCLTSDRGAGGHVLDCSLEDVKISLQTISNFSMTMLKNGAQGESRARFLKKSGSGDRGAKE